MNSTNLDAIQISCPTAGSLFCYILMSKLCRDFLIPSENQKFLVKKAALLPLENQ
jgi:hypothetical protein